MGIKQKFFLLAGIIGAVLAIVSAIGYYTAQDHLTASIEQGMAATVDFKATEIDGWLDSKAQVAVASAKILHNLDDTTGSMREMMGSMDGDSEIDELTNGNENGLFMTWKSGNVTTVDPRARGWYKDAKAAGKLIFTDAYQGASNNKVVVSAAVPYNDKTGAFRGAICEDISLGVLTQQVAAIQYKGEGSGIIIEKTGKILASSGANETFKDIQTNAELKDHFQEMLKNNMGSFKVEQNGVPAVFAYSKVKSTGWIVGMIIPESVIYSELNSLKITYIVLTAIGIILLVFLSLKFSGTITKSIINLTKHADELAKGNLRVKDLTIDSNDEIGHLVNAFNIMSKNVRNLIAKMATTSEQVAASSEELTAGAGQSAEAANHVAATIEHVSDGMNSQMQTIEQATVHIESMVMAIAEAADKTESVNQISVQTADAAQSGENLLNEAINQMNQIETSVTQSAVVVENLGENSQQIGKIVEVISSIADQTNLLALNAAIEAARAGEAGRGFSVVAEEVRKLAEQSQTATEEIKNLILKIQGDTKQAVSTMGIGTSNVKTGAAAIRNVGTQFANIFSMVNDIRDRMTEIAASVQGVSIGSQKIVEAIMNVDSVSRDTAGETQSISAATQEQSASMEEIASASQSLAQMAEAMQETIHKFKI
jgi:methyl-accepting chemotaxis protein